jgi:hypothetical protein
LILTELDTKQYTYLLVIKELYRQQLEMYQEKTHSIPSRIVSIHQPHIRPMLRGKQGKNETFKYFFYLILNLGSVLKYHFWVKNASLLSNNRQQIILNKLMDNFEAT